MKKSKNAVKEINRIIADENLDRVIKARLLNIKKTIEYGEINFTDGLSNSMFKAFYKDYVDEISIWLHEPKNIVIQKINMNELTEVENKLILTNILLQIQQNKIKEDYETVC